MKFTEHIRWHYIALFALAIILYANTLRHGFVLDDEVVITQNDYVQQGIKGIPSIFSHDSFAGFGRVGEGNNLLTGGRYRPLSLGLFAIVYSVFGANQIAFHSLAIFLYGCCGLILYQLLLLMLKDVPKGMLIAFLTTILFIVHPVHTEVVANVKSCDEQLALLFGLGAMTAMFKSWDLKNRNWAILTGLLFLTACLAKENAITLVAIGPLALWYFRKVKLPDLVLYALPLIMASVLFLIIRATVAGWSPTGQEMYDPLNNPFLQWNQKAWIPCTSVVKAATIIYALGQYLRLMVFPFPLTHDYYPLAFELRHFSDPLVWGCLLIILIIAIYGIMSVLKKEITGFGILFFLIAMSITSNILFPVGTFIAERFLFLPSVGFCLAFTILMVRLFGIKGGKLVIPVIGLIAVTLSACTIMRNPAWKDNETLLQTDLQYSPRSIKLQNDFGTILLTKALQIKDKGDRQAMLEQSAMHLKLATDLHPNYYDAYLAYGACMYYQQKYRQSVDAYRTAFQMYPDDVKSKTGLQYALKAYGTYLAGNTDLEAGISILEEAWGLKPDAEIASSLAYYFHPLGNKTKVVEWSEKAVALKPDDAQLNYKLAKAYKESGNNDAAAKAYQKAKELDPTLEPL